MRLSSITQKILVSLTGLFLSLFLVVHLIGNLQLLKSDEGLSFNKYAVFMTSNPLIKCTSYLLYIIILFHAFKGLYLAWRNKRSRKVSYLMTKRNTNSAWYSRSMGILGSIILIFIVAHMSNFWYEYKFGHVPYSSYVENMITGEIVRNDIPPSPKAGAPIIHNKMEEFVNGDKRIVIIKDLHASVTYAFRNEVWIVALYTLAMVALGFHLLHGFKSAFQTLGLGNKHIIGIVNFLGAWVFAILVPLAFAFIPIYIYVLSLF